MDVDGNGTRDLDPSRISYFGQSFGGIYGTKFLAVEPNVRLGVPNVPGGAIVEIARLSPVFRGLVTLSLINRTPPLINLPGFAVQREHAAAEPAAAGRHRPGRVRDPTVARVDGVDVTGGEPGRVCRRTYARSRCRACRRSRSSCSTPAQTQTVPNPTTSAIIRAGGLEDRTTLFRNDLAFAADPTFPKNPHTFLTRLPGLSHAQRRRRGTRGPGSDRAVLRLQRRGRRRSRRRRGRSSRRRWSAHRRRIWPTSREPGFRHA